MAGDRGSEQVGAVHVDGEQLAHALDRVVSGLEVFTETGAGHQIVNLAMLREDLGDAVVDTSRIRHVGEVGSDLGRPG